ncbi:MULTISPECIES: flavoprotein [Streptomyces]|uniref:Flavoprotein n=1 Tax=Streptomyces fimbriatus TaxID=68197 RepID=A0ABW0D5E4_STRFI
MTQEALTPDAPLLNVRRLLFIGTGSASSVDLPGWLGWLRATHPDLETQVVLTRSAERFVTLQAVTGITGRVALRDSWPDDPTVSVRHVELAEWAEAMVVHPATLAFTARFAQGLADSPALLAVQCTRAPVGLAPALPPGGADSHAYRMHAAALEARPNVVVLPPVPGHSQTTGRMDSWAPGMLPDLLTRLERCRTALAETETETATAARARSER